MGSKPKQRFLYFVRSCSGTNVTQKRLCVSKSTRVPFHCARRKQCRLFLQTTFIIYSQRWYFMLNYNESPNFTLKTCWRTSFLHRGFSSLRPTLYLTNWKVAPKGERSLSTPPHESTWRHLEALRRTQRVRSAPQSPISAARRRKWNSEHVVVALCSLDLM